LPWEDSDATLAWLRPLARNQFEQRLIRDKHARPLFMTTDNRRLLSDTILAKYGLMRGEENWNSYPDCSDPRHYANENFAPHLPIVMEEEADTDALPPLEDE